jgi:hypothetical protein
MRIGRMTMLLLAMAAVSLAAAAQMPRPLGEQSAVAALARLGVPLGYDAAGRVRWIEASKGELSDEALAYLPRTPRLEWLEIGGGRITASGMAALKGCTALTRLYIHDVNLDNDSMTWISGLRLEALSLQRTQLSPKAVPQVSGIGTLVVLNLSGNDITDADAGPLARIAGLEVLALQNTKVTGAGLAKLKGMARLNVLNLENCGIDDRDAQVFYSMPNLRIVHGAGCRISDDAVAEFNEKLPMLAIFR